MIFPETGSIKEFAREKLILEVEYTCNSNTCNFNGVLSAIKNNPTLRYKWFVAETCNLVVQNYCSVM